VKENFQFQFKHVLSCTDVLVQGVDPTSQLMRDDLADGVITQDSTNKERFCFNNSFLGNDQVETIPLSYRGLENNKTEEKKKNKEKLSVPPKPDKDADGHCTPAAFLPLVLPCGMLAGGTSPKR